MAAERGAGGGSSTYTQARGGGATLPGWLSLDGLQRAAWTAVDLLTLFARSLLDPAVKTLQDGGSGGANGTGVRRVHSVHTTTVRGSGAMAGGGAGNRLGGGGSGPAGPGGATGSGSGSSRIAGVGSLKPCSTGG